MMEELKELDLDNPDHIDWLLKWAKQADLTIKAQTDRIERLFNGNTDLIDALMDMVNQHCSCAGGVETMGLSANENALEVLEQAGFAQPIKGRVYRLNWVHQLRFYWDKTTRILLIPVQEFNLICLAPALLR